MKIKAFLLIVLLLLLLISCKSETNTNYIININSGKFHYDYCYSAKRISNTNKIVSDSDKEDLISQGFSPCGNCNL